MKCSHCRFSRGASVPLAVQTQASWKLALHIHMKTLAGFLVLIVAAIPHSAPASSTIDPVNPHAWGANIGWLNWRADEPNGAVIGEFVCAGYIYAANFGWIHLGDGIPGTGSVPTTAHYSNTAANDYGVNVLPTAQIMKANLRGLAYGANIGWINFENAGNPQVDLATGALSGYAWGANVGWINLGQAGVTLRTQRLEPGIDTDGDGIPDAFELLHAGGLATMNTGTDTSGNGMLDIDAYRAGLDPTDPNSRFAIIEVTLDSGGTVSLTWTSPTTRLFRIHAREFLHTGSWGLALDNIHPAGATTSTSLIAPATNTQFYRVVAFRPLVQE